MAEPEKPKQSRGIFKLFNTAMKKYKKAKVVAKNNPQGSYAAGCPAKNTGSGTLGQGGCKDCDRAI